MKPLGWTPLALAFVVFAVSLATLAGEAAAVPWENGEPPISLGNAVEAPCEYCSSLQATVVGPADGVAFQAASSPLEKGYAHELNNPCLHDPKTEAADKCPQPLYSEPIEQGLAASWFVPETDTYRVWALGEAGTCVPKVARPYETEEPGCVPRQEVCSTSRTVTLPAMVNVACTDTHATRSANRHRGRR
jgi:hypothetical protein